MTCRYCGFDLNDGDIYEVLKSKPDFSAFSAYFANQLVLEDHRAQRARSGNEQNWTTD